MVSALLAGQGGLGRWTPMLVRADVATMSLGSTYLVTIVVKRHPRSNHQHQWYPGNMRPPLREQWSEKSPVKCQISESSVLLLLLVAAFYGQWSKILTCQVCVCHWYRLWPPSSLWQTDLTLSTSSTILLGKTSSRHERDIVRYYCLIFPWAVREFWILVLIDAWE